MNLVSTDGCGYNAFCLSQVIYIARNPKDTVVSLLAFTKLTNYATFMGTMDDFAQLFVDGTGQCFDLRLLILGYCMSKGLVVKLY